jgi:DUF1680 family protein
MLRVAPVAVATLLCAAPVGVLSAAAAPVPAYVKAGPAPERKPVADLQGGALGVERVPSSVGTPAPYRVFLKGDSHWLQIDLGAAQPVEAVKLYSFAKDKIDGKPDGVSPDAFPVRFKIETADTPDFAAPRLVADHTGADFKPPFGHMPVLTFKPAATASARYVRLTVTKPGHYAGRPALMLWRFEVISGGRDVATGKTLSDAASGDLGKHVLLRPRRPEGEDVHFDHPEQATDPATWKPVRAPLRTPTSGVVLGGLFKDVFERNISYLLGGFTTDDYTRHFLQRAGKPHSKDGRRDRFWTEILTGANTGRFLMGAGNTLRWREHAELRDRLNRIVAVIKDCARPDGYIMAFPEERILVDQTNGYVRSWVTNGLIEAGRAGNPDAFPLLRRWGDWFNTCPYLPEMAMRVAIGWQGMIANSRTYVDTPIGVPADIQVLQRYFQLNFWLKALAERDPAALWSFTYDRPHSYLIVTFNAIADMYVATGDTRYLDAAKGAWETILRDFQHTGGAVTLIESFELMARRDPPNARLLRAANGETCGNIFLAFLSQQLRVLFPEEERYAAELEKSLYNVALAAQQSDGKIRYHARQIRRKEGGSQNNSCCEGQGTRFFASLPEFIYKISDDGVWVDLFNESALTWERGGAKFTLEQHTAFPVSPEVTLKISAAGSAAPAAAAFKLRVRVPSWATSPVTFSVNGVPAVTGAPGSYVALERVWRAGDTVAFTLPLGFRVSKYAGVEKGFAGAESYALQYGPFLMGLLAKDIPGDGVRKLPLKVSELVGRLRPVAGKPLHFRIEGLPPENEYLPYFEIQGEDFTCYPVFE